MLLAGDIGNDTDTLKHFANLQVPVLHLAGKYEYYGDPLPALRGNIPSECTKHSITFLNIDVVTLS